MHPIEARPVREIVLVTAESFQRGDVVTELCVYGPSHLSGVEKCLAVKQYSDGCLLADLSRALDKMPLPTLFHPPSTPAEDFRLLVLEMFLRFKKRVNSDD